MYYKYNANNVQIILRTANNSKIMLNHNTHVLNSNMYIIHEPQGLYLNSIPGQQTYIHSCTKLLNST